MEGTHSHVTRGLRKLTSRGSASKRLPVTPNIMQLLLSVWESHPVRFDAVMLWAASCMCFFGFLRSGEVVVSADSQYNPAYHLSNGDVRVNDTVAPEFLEVHIKASKTDPFCQGVRVYLGKSGADICPVAAILAYMVRRGGQPGPFFIFADGHPLTREQFVTTVQLALRSRRLDASSYAGTVFG